jgi:hypothetical protein
MLAARMNISFDHAKYFVMLAIFIILSFLKASAFWVKDFSSVSTA